MRAATDPHPVALDADRGLLGERDRRVAGVGAGPGAGGRGRLRTGAEVGLGGVLFGGGGDGGVFAVGEVGGAAEVIDEVGPVVIAVEDDPVAGAAAAGAAV